MPDTIPKYPDVKVKLSGTDGNAFAILGRVASAARAAKVPNEEIRTFYDEAMAGDYDELLRTCMRWFSVS